MLIMAACHIAIEQCGNVTSVQYSDIRGVQHLQNVSIETKDKSAEDVRCGRSRRMRVEASWT